MIAARESVSRLREPFCALSHGAGALLALAGLVAMLDAAHGQTPTVVGCTLYGVSLFVLYLTSALYHGIPLGPRALERFQRLDHIGIFLLIAGTYAPFCLVSLHDRLGWELFGLEYGLALTGIAGVVLLGPRLPDAVRVALYIVMGWLIVAAWPQVCLALPPAARDGLVAGGLFYSVGVVVFATDRPHLRPGKFSAHDLWHVFSLCGSACHFYVIWRYVA